MSAAKDPVPRVYAAISAITSELAAAGIAKKQVNTAQGYRFRGIDDVMQALAPLLAKHRLCILPRVLEREARECKGQGDAILGNVFLRVAFDIVSARDASRHAIEVTGEALDAGDKATAKAMSAAWKQAMIQTFCIPSGQDDTESESHCRHRAPSPQADPVQGWDQWTSDLCDRIAGCPGDAAVNIIQSTYREQLRTLSRRRPELYAEVGRILSKRRNSASEPVLPARVDVPGSHIEQGNPCKPLSGGPGVDRQPSASVGMQPAD